MARDDYHVIVYQILAYLYQCLKKGVKVDVKSIEYDGPYFSINKSYWAYIIWHMQKSGLIEGVKFYTNGLMTIPLPAELEECQITPEGIACLCDNSLMEKAKRFLKDVKEITPFM